MSESPTSLPTSVQDYLSSGLTPWEAAGDEGVSGGGSGHANDTLLCSNLSFSMFGREVSVPRNPETFLALSGLHVIFVVLPALFLSPLAIFLLVRRSLSRHPTNTIFCWLCVACILGPCSYGLLMDAGLISDRPLLGRCERRWEGMVLWLCYACAITTYDFLLAFSAATFYVTLRYNIRRFSQPRLNALLACVVVLAFLVASMWLVMAESHSLRGCRIRGSFCITFFGGNSHVAMALEVIRIACALVPLNVSVAISLLLYYKKVRTSVLELDRDILGSVLRLFVVLSLGSLTWNAPTLIVHFGSFDGTQRGFVEMVSTYTLQLNFTLFPLLTLALHREVRQRLLACFRGMFRLERHPQPLDDGAQSCTSGLETLGRGVGALDESYLGAQSSTTMLDPTPPTPAPSRRVTCRRGGGGGGGGEGQEVGLGDDDVLVAGQSCVKLEMN